LISVTPANISFGNVPVGATSTQTVTVCYSSDQNLPLSSPQTLQIGVRQRVLCYQVEYLNASNQVVASDLMSAVAVP
jgi:hypothetical protein